MGTGTSLAAFVPSCSLSFSGLGSTFAVSRRPIVGRTAESWQPSQLHTNPCAASSAVRRLSSSSDDKTEHCGVPSMALVSGIAAICGVGSRRRGRCSRRIAVRAYTSASQTYEGAPISPPPDLPSLLLKNRIVFLGAPITNEVTELIIAQLLYLNYESTDKPVTLYINSTGSTIKNSNKFIGEAKVGLETDAFAISDCIRYIKPAVTTIAIGQAYGTAALLLALGAKGKRFALPNTTIMLSEPREPPARGSRQAADIKILAQEVLKNRSTMADMMATATGKTADQFKKDTSRCRYMSPEEAVEYGIIDRVLAPDKLKQQVGMELPAFIKDMI